MEFGEIMNILICTAGAASAFAYVHTLSGNIPLQKSASLTSLKSLMLYWSLTGTYFALAGVNTATASLGAVEHTLIFRLNIIIFGLMSLPLIYNISYILLSNRLLVHAVPTFFIVINVVLLGTILQNRIIGPVFTYWGPLFMVRSLYPTIAYLAALFIIPVVMIMGFLFLMGIGKIPPGFGNKIVFSLVSISFVFDFVFLDIIAQSGEMMVAARIFAFLGTVLGYISYLSSHAEERVST